MLVFIMTISLSLSVKAFILTNSENILITESVTHLNNRFVVSNMNQTGDHLVYQCPIGSTFAIVSWKRKIFFPRWVENVIICKSNNSKLGNDSEISILNIVWHKRQRIRLCWSILSVLKGKKIKNSIEKR